MLQAGERAGSTTYTLPPQTPPDGGRSARTRQRQHRVTAFARNHEDYPASNVPPGYGDEITCSRRYKLRPQPTLAQPGVKPGHLSGDEVGWRWVSLVVNAACIGGPVVDLP
jgi:hypothetical protein